jgi:SAM-dependent methyltransferase
MADSELDAVTSISRKRWNARYGEGNTPWDTQVTPPEVVGFWEDTRHPRQGVALDLGCGTGTNVRYLAALGLIAFGVELAGAPLMTALERYRGLPSALRSRIHLVCSDVCRLPLTHLNAAYVLDVGCLHTVPPTLRPEYARSVFDNMAPGGYYHLFAFDHDVTTPQPESGPMGMASGEVAQLFAPHLILVEEIVARPDRRPFRWYLLHRPH